MSVHLSGIVYAAINCLYNFPLQNAYALVCLNLLCYTLKWQSGIKKNNSYFKLILLNENIY